ncbi:MAG: tyrosine--tRNA ligase [Chloroflexi bacterium]|nr:tyrosine--tRNA ligase [Chloroflexota bacterium]
MTVRTPTDAELHRILNRGVAEIIVRDEFVRLLKAGKRLRLKQGFDPSAPDIHLGHAVGMRKLRQLQELGHTVVLIVGDWTAQIGDPSGRSATRKMLIADEVARNAETYLQQFFRIVDKDRTEVRRQTEWFNNFGLADVIQLTRKFTVAQILKRDDFAKRYADNQPIAVTEMLYPLLQAYDSVMVKADVEFGGTDQRFNNLLGRELQGIEGQRPQQVFLVPLLVGTDGAQKMSKSLGNYIGVAEPPESMFGKTMSIPDTLLPLYFELLTDVSDDELASIKRSVESHDVNPMDLKKRLGRELVAQFHGANAAQAAQANFERVVQRKEVPEDIPTLALPFAGNSGHANADLVAKPGQGSAEVHLARLLVRAGLAPSAAEVRRLLKQGAVRLDGRQLGEKDIVVTLSPNAKVQVGNRRFVQVVDG